MLETRDSFVRILPTADPASDLESRREALNDLLHEHWEYTMRHNPIYATILGAKRYNDQLDDFSQQFIDANLEQVRKFVARFEAIDTAGFTEPWPAHALGYKIGQLGNPGTARLGERSARRPLRPPSLPRQVLGGSALPMDVPG